MLIAAWLMEWNIMECNGIYWNVFIWIWPVATDGIIGKSGAWPKIFGWELDKVWKIFGLKLEKY